jgi:hypothetical protein
VTGLNWLWIAVMGFAPLPVAVLVATPVWRRSEMILGNIAGAAVIFGTGLVLILREHAELDTVVQGCLDRGMTCWPEPAAFTRYAIFAAIALVEVIVLFAVSLRVEARQRNRGYAPEWRR